ncbi:MAG TPA: VWA domain-containing protein [Candidatus Angelobacter sp.]|nr:VWA domain-containing protein [Candidatus Angelobacter sp.]
MLRLTLGTKSLIFAMMLAGAALAGQQGLPDAPKPKDQQAQQTQQNVPDGPQPKAQPQNQFPENAPPAPINSHPEQPAAAATPTPATQAQRPALGQGGMAGKRDDLYQMSISVNFVQIPVTVKDGSGRLVPGLTSNDFKVYEDGVPQQLKFFTADPFPLSAAIVVATDLPATTMKKVNETLPALIAAFSEFDEVALYRYGHTVQQISGFAGAPSVSTASINRIKRPGRQGGPPMTGGPFGGGPTINGHSVNDPNAGGPGDVQTPPREFYVLNDAILRAAQDLSKRDKSRRRIIFVISDGRELGSSNSYDEVKKILLSNNVSVYGVGVDTAAIPIYDKANRIRIPGFGTGNILPKYVSDTAGDMLAEFDRAGIEQAYSKIADTARNQYTLGYTTQATKSSAFRTIDVRVLRPNLNVFAKQGYYPLPPQPQQRP